ncbi:MAG: hypothetical protein AMXMBFR33_65110 [Candidatus Xenobia bacterium]|jgi:hypothetical protein
MALVALVMGSVQALVAAAARYYNISTSTIEVQQNLLTAMSKVCFELGESSPTSVRADSVAPGGVVFATPRNARNVLVYGTGVNAGKAEWSRYLCYYVDTINGESCLIRKEKTVPATYGPPILPAGETTAAYQASPGNYRIVARRVTAFSVIDSAPMTITMTAQDVRGEFSITMKSVVQPKN